jgi:ribosome maturation factor RimP
VQTFEAVAGNRHWQGRLGKVDGKSIRLELEGKKAAGRGKKDPREKAQSAASKEVEIALSNIEKAQLVPEF